MAGIICLKSLTANIIFMTFFESLTGVLLDTNVLQTKIGNTIKEKNTV